MELVLVVLLVAAVVLAVFYALRNRTESRSATDNAVPADAENAVGSKEDTEIFNEKFVAANVALVGGDSDALKNGISLLIESLDYTEEFRPHVRNAVQKLYGALSHHDRADTKGPWNRDLSGYGVLSWKADLYDRDRALQLAWEDISAINEALLARGMGWKY